MPCESDSEHGCRRHDMLSDSDMDRSDSDRQLRDGELHIELRSWCNVPEGYHDSHLHCEGFLRQRIDLLIHSNGHRQYAACDSRLPDESDSEYRCRRNDMLSDSDVDRTDSDRQLRDAELYIELQSGCIIPERHDDSNLHGH